MLRRLLTVMREPAPDRRPAWPWVVVSALGLAAAFAFDASTPRGFTFGAPFSLVVLLTALSGSRRAVSAVGLVAIGLVWAGAAIAPGAPLGIGRELILASLLFPSISILITVLLAVAVLRLIARTDERLERNRQLLEIASRTARIGGWALDLGRERISWSDEVARIHGRPPGETLSVDAWVDLYAPEDRGRLRERVAACAGEGRAFDEELRIPLPGGPRWVRAVGEAVRVPGGPVGGLRGAIQDISDRKEAEERERALAERLVTSLENMTEGFYTLDREWRFTYLNAEAERVLRRDRQGLLGRVVWEALPGTLATALESALRRAVDERRSVTFELHDERLDVWLSMTAHVVPDGLAVYFHDVTGQRRMEAALAESEERFRLIGQATSDAMWDWDLRTDRIWWSAGMESLFGHSLEALEGDSSARVALIHPADRERILEAIRRTLDGRGISWEAEYRFARRDGSYATVRDTGFVVRDASGTAVRMVGGMTDVTEQRRLEEQLRQSQRLEALGQLTGGVAHDFNNLLTVLLGNAELLAEELAERPEDRELAELMVAAARRGAELTQRLLAFARRQALEPRVVDVNRLVTDLHPLLRRAVGEQVELQIVPSARLAPALVDPGQLESALLNLALNARDAMAGGGRLEIETGEVELHPGDAGLEPDVAPGSYVTITVADTGAGIAPADLERVFEPFFTTKHSGQGTGLGLSMVYGFVKQSGGHVRISSQTGRGTQVRLYLPPADRVLPGDGSAGQPKAAAERGHEAILLVEDDVLVRRFVEEQLSSLGYRVTSVDHGPAALERLRSEAPVDLLLTDVVMPGGLNGRQLAEAARQLRPELPVLLSSGYAEEAILVEGRLDRGLHVLNKPYGRADLARAVRLALDRR